MKYVLFLVIGITLGAVIMWKLQDTSNKKQTTNNQESRNKKQTEKAVNYPVFSVEEPPKDSLQGAVSDTKGSLLYEPRGATEAAAVSEVTVIKQGERLITEKNGAALITFPNVGTIQMGENTDLSFIQTLPVNLALWHNNGTATYTVTGATPVSVRIRSALLTKKNGEMTITMKDGDSVVLIKTTKGTAMIGYNDPDNVTQVFELREGQTYEYNSDDRTTINQAAK